MLVVYMKKTLKEDLPFQEFSNRRMSYVMMVTNDPVAKKKNNLQKFDFKIFRHQSSMKKNPNKVETFSKKKELYNNGR